VRTGRIVVAALTTTVLTACTGGGGSSSANGPGGSDSATVGQAHQVIDATDLSDPATIAAVEKIRFTDGGVQAAREAIEAGADGDPLWAATWVYATSGTNPAPLQPLLQNGDPSIRVMAAAALVSLGEPAAFDVLVSAVATGEPLRGSFPPQSISAFATFTLSRYTGVDLGNTENASAAAIKKASDDWTAWLAQNRDDLTFDAAAKTWSTG